MGSEGGGGKPQRAQGLQIWYEGEEMKLAKLVFLLPVTYQTQ